MTIEAETDAIVALIRPIADLMDGRGLSHDARVTLLSGLLAQEACCLPPTERMWGMRKIMKDLPGIFFATQQGMREVLMENARGGDA